MDDQTDIIKKKDMEYFLETIKQERYYFLDDSLEKVSDKNIIDLFPNLNIDDINIPIMQQGTSCAKIDFNNKIYSIVIKDDVWIGSKCILLSGTYLEKGCVVSAGSVVSGKFDPYSVIAGNPARVIKKRI